MDEIVEILIEAYDVAWLDGESGTYIKPRRKRTNKNSRSEMNKPIRIQRKRTKGWHMPPNTIYVGRPSKFGNPFDVTPDRSRADVVIAFRIWLTQDGCHANMVERKLRLVKSLSELRGKNLACFCPLDQPCHADVLLEIANEFEVTT